MSQFNFLSSYINKLPDSEQTDYKLNSGKDEAEIDAIERKAGIKVPDELKTFYKFSYGAKLDEYKILTVPEIAEYIAQLRWTYENSWRSSIIPFAYLMGVGDFIAFDLEESNTEGLLILDCFHESSSEEWSGICYGLKHWLQKMTNSNFRPFWL